MEWIEILKEPITLYDVLCGASGYICYNMVRKIYKNIKN